MTQQLEYQTAQEKLIAENERLRTALKEIIKEVGTSTKANKIAVAALNEQNIAEEK